MNYLTFDLCIERSAEKFRARVLNSPGGEADCDFSAPITDQELRIFRLETTRARPDLRRAEPEELRGAREFGQKLFNAVFVGEVNGCLVRSLQKIQPGEVGLRVRIHLSKAPELINLPWEYLYESTTGQFLALSKDTPVVRYLELPVEPRSLAVKPPVRMLVIISSPKDQAPLDVKREWKKLEDGLSRLTATGLVVLDKLEKPSFSSLLKQLEKEQYHILHFVGHGQYDRARDEGVLLFEDEEGNAEPITSQALGVLVHDEATLRLVVLNSCEGAISDSTDVLSGTAQNLIQQGVPAVIAMQSEISEGGAQAFSETFYESLARGAPVDAALASARKVLFGALSAEWGAPVLYMRSPDGRLFEVGRLTVEITLVDADRAIARKDWKDATSKLNAVLAMNATDERAKEKLEFVRSQQRAAAQRMVEADRAIAAQDWETARAKLKAAAEISPNDEHVKDGLALLPKPVEATDSTASAPAVTETAPTAGPVPLISQTGAAIRPPKPNIFARIVQSPRFAPTVLLAFVFVVNWFETAMESVVPAWRSWNGARSIFSAYNFHELEKNLSFDYQGLADGIAVYGYSFAYFFLFPLLGLAVAIALARTRRAWAYRSFAIAVAIDYAITLPLFLAFPVPERWSYPDAEAILLSDQWSAKLIEAIRPISGIDNCFPSIHVSLTVIFIAYCYRYKLRLRWPALILGTIVILSTFVLGIHWIADIVAGLVLGLLSAHVAMLIERRKEDLATATQSLRLKLEKWSSGVRKMSDLTPSGKA
jgi:membrane-associated phospholipid phosphatase